MNWMLVLYKKDGEFKFLKSKILDTETHVLEQMDQISGSIFEYMSLRVVTSEENLDRNKHLLFVRALNQLGGAIDKAACEKEEMHTFMAEECS